MKGARVLLTAAFILIFSSAYAYSAKVIGLEGKVMIRENKDAVWSDAAVGDALGAGSEVQTFTASSCTMAFDDEKKNVVALKEDSNIRIESISPGNIFLSEGRVFSLIKNIERKSSFEIRTPTVTAGARGTGWSVSKIADTSRVKCFEDRVNIKANDKSGNEVRVFDLKKGFGVAVDENGSPGAVFELVKQDLWQWNEFRRDLDKLRQSKESVSKDGRESLGILEDETEHQDLRQEQESSFHEDEYLEERRESEDNTSGGGSITSP